jgi:hypothetical protein
VDFLLGYALTLRLSNNLEAATKHLISVMDAQQTMLGAQHEDTRKTMSELASIYHLLGRISDAEALQFKLRVEKELPADPIPEEQSSQSTDT